MSERMNPLNPFDPRSIKVDVLQRFLFFRENRNCLSPEIRKPFILPLSLFTGGDYKFKIKDRRDRSTWFRRSNQWLIEMITNAVMSFVRVRSRKTLIIAALPARPLPTAIQPPSPVNAVTRVAPPKSPTTPNSITFDQAGLPDW